MELIVVFSTMLISKYFLVAIGLGWRWYCIDVCTNGHCGGNVAVVVWTNVCCHVFLRNDVGDVNVDGID